ncbi:MAG: FecR domain-containing protein [Odoribacter sp.]|nr:FecR domain-containing protein [Odoribacter sp.]
MDWEEINGCAKKTAVRAVYRLSEEEGKHPEAADGLLQEMTETPLLHEEKERRKRYDSIKAFRRAWWKNKKRIIRRSSTVACSLAMLAGGLWFLLHAPAPETGTPVAEYGIHGNGQVILQLSDGRHVALGNDDTLQLWEQEKPVEVRGGAIAYSGDPETREQKTIQNVLSVPKGAEFQVQLSDGTLVHLNADSELKYPPVFAGKERRVYLKGEAWFEVAKNPETPFYVVAEDMEIRVYGTSFNVNTHDAQAIRTVLAEGHIGVRSLRTGGETQVVPGQLAEYGRKDRSIRLREVNVRQYTAWKDGCFYFDDKTLEEIMGELSRWYDMEIVYRSMQKEPMHFSGYLPRYKDVRKVLSTLTESVGLCFEVVEQKIIVD